MNPLDSFKIQLACKTHNITEEEEYFKLIEEGKCLQCKEEAIPKCYSEAGVKEYFITHICEECFDAIFAGNEQDELAAQSHNEDDQDEPAF